MQTPATPANRLIHESSPYLLQHAHNPVDWYPWGADAFAKAQAEDKPVFLSIGYSTCHWCHVMEKESFEDEAVADLLNRAFVAVKVDKEERPDVDALYMRVCQALTGSGGWPLTILMTPAQQPFFAGTYLPKHTRRGLRGLLELLEAVRDAWREDNRQLYRAAADVTRRFTQPPAPTIRETTPPPEAELLRQAAHTFRRGFDPLHGGFGGAPKFPCPHNLLFLLRLYDVTRERDLLDMAAHTLTHMYQGGLFDHIGGGFSRYATDERWLVPHFEKMLYDNALLTMAYAQAYVVTREPLYKTIAMDTMQYVFRELTDEQGGFYAAQDADSEGEEGKYYTFTRQELCALLGDADGDAFCRYYGISEAGDFEGRSIPHRLAAPSPAASVTPPPPRLDALRAKVYDYRKNRAALHKDDKILTSWNGLMIAALSMASRLLGEPRLLDAAQKALRFIEGHLMENGRLYTSWRKGRTGAAGFLDDYAYLAWAYLETYQATCQAEYVQKAAALCKEAAAGFFDNDQGGFYLNGKDNEQLFMRVKETYDGALPSGNAVMAYNLTLLFLLEEHDLDDALTLHTGFMNREAAAYPSGNAFYWLAVLQRDHPTSPAHCAIPVTLPNPK